MSHVACHCYDAPVTRNRADTWSIAAACLVVGGQIFGGFSQNVNVETPQVRKSIQVNDSQPTSIGSLVLSLKDIDQQEESGLMSPPEVVALGHEFGFSNVKWAEVFGVSRDLVQKWAANATVNLQPKNIARATTFNELKNYMKPEHVPYLAKLTQGFLEIEELSSALKDKSSTSEELQALYDKYYSKFDGVYKRSLLG